MNRDLPRVPRNTDPLVSILHASIVGFGPEKIERILDEVARATAHDDGRWATAVILSRTEWDIVVAGLGVLLARVNETE